jgi:ribose transport system permease protein
MIEPSRTDVVLARLYEHRMILVMLGVLALLITIVGIMEPNFFLGFNLQNNGKRLALLSIYAMGCALAIITAGIDLSVGSVIALAAVLMPLLVMNTHIPFTEHLVPVWAALPLVLLLGATLGAFHGVLIAKLNLQPFIVTLCGLLAYRGIARGITGDMVQGFQNKHEALRQLAVGTFLHIPNMMYIMLAIAVVIGLFLHGTVWGRHLYALGQNEEAARYSGINVDRLKIAAYTISGLLAGVAGILLALDTNTVQPSDAAKMYELYGIAAAVLGGCSLRGGEGTVIGVIVGATVLTVLRNLIILARLSTYIEDALIGGVIASMVIIDQVVKMRAAARARAAGR